MRWLLVALSFAHIGCIAGAFPAARFEAGAGMVTGGKPASDARGRVAVGTHLNSYVSAPVDVGAGYQAEYDLAYGPPEPDEAKKQLLGGLYVEMSKRTHRSDHHRSFVGLRGSMLWPGHDPSGIRDAVMTVAVRADVELFGRASGAGAGGDNCVIGAGFWHGIGAIGTYIESGYRTAPDREHGFVVTAGVTVRTPIIAGFAGDLCAPARLLR